MKKYEIIVDDDDANQLIEMLESLAFVKQVNRQ